MIPQLYAGRWNTARTTMLEFVERPAQVRARCSLPGWLQRLEITVKAKSRLDAYERYLRHHGQGMAIFDTWGYRPILDGWVYEIIPDGRHVTYIVGGGWKRMSDEYETDPPASSTTDTDVYLKSVLTNHAPAISSNHDNISATGTDMGDSFELGRNTGSTPQEIAKYVADAGTSSNYILDFWLRTSPFNRTALQGPEPWLAVRKTLGEYYYQIDKRDLVDMTFSRHLWDLANDVVLYFTWTTKLNGAHSASDTTLTVDSISNFAVGDEIEVSLDDDKTYRTSITNLSGSVITVLDGLPHSAPDDGVVYRRKPLQDTSAATDSASQSDYWERERRIVVDDLFGNFFSSTQAAQIRDGILADFKGPAHEASFVIGAPYFRTDVGARWPTYRMLFMPTYLRINDLYPTEALTDFSLDAKSVFFTHAMDYDHNARRLRITPDAFFGDNRLDVILQRLGIGVGQAVMA